MKEQEVDKKQPEITFRAGEIKAIIWSNKRKKDEREYEVKSVVLEKSYKDGDEWKKTNSLNENDVQKAILVLKKAHEYIFIKV